MSESSPTVRARLRSRSGMPRDVWVLAANAFCVSIGYGVMMPVLPAFARRFGVDNFSIGLVVSAFAFMRMVTAPWCGAAIDRLGARWVLGVGVFTVAASSVAAGLAASFTQLVIFRGLGGIGSAMFTVASTTMLIRAVGPELRGRASGFYQGGFLLGGMAGPALGGFVALISMSAPFFFYAFTLVIGGTLCLTLIRRPARPDGATLPHKQPGRPLREVLGDARYQAALLMNFAVGWQSIGVRSALIPIYVGTTLALGTQWTGYAMAAAAVAQTAALIPFGRLTDTWGRRPVMVLGGLICASATVFMPWTPTIAWLIVALCVYGVGAAMLGTAPTAAVGDAVGPRGGTPIALFSMTSDIGVIIGPLVAGALSDRYGMRAAFVLGAALLAVAAVHALRMPRGFATSTRKERDTQELRAGETAQEECR